MVEVPAHFRFATPEVIYSEEPLVVADGSVVQLLKAIASDSPRKRARLCAHPSPSATEQEMLIVMRGDSYVRPHRHFGKSETFTLLEGEADVVIFDEAGTLTDKFQMAPFGSDEPFFYRMPEGVFHTLIFRTDWLVYLETTAGPFDPSKSESAPWAPAESENGEGLRYLNNLVMASVV